MMRPIYEFQTIQVELTNACVHECSNCTRFCGHHRKNFFMDWTTFKNAIDSLAEWPRLIGIMGGEPTLHPEFRRFVEYAAQMHPMAYNIGGGHTPMKSLSKYIFDANALKGDKVNKWRGLGLWSSVCGSYYKHYETIQDNFIFQCINDHTASSRHHAWLLTRKEFDISDADWVKMRDNCWWQRLLGSPSITPKGAFFCEVAAAMDVLFNGDGGWKVEKGWWKRDPDDFKEQLKWCEYCAGAFISFDRDANEGRDDVSPIMLEMLKKIDSPKVKQNRVVVHESGEKSDIEVKPRDYMLMYQTDPELRFTEKNKALYPQKIWALLAGKGVEKFPDTFAVGVKTIFDNIYTLNNGESLGRKILAARFDGAEWLAIFYDSAKEFDDFALREKMNRTIFNPGTLHIFNDFGMLFFNMEAQSLEKMGYPNIGKCESVADLIAMWPEDKICELDRGFSEIINGDIEEWNKNIVQKGLMRWDQEVKSELSIMVIRRQIVPQIEEISLSTNDIEEKFNRLQSVSFHGANPAMICDKVKTAVHNELMSYLSHATFSELTDIIRKNNGFIFSYAAALLSDGENIEQSLLDCVSDTANEYALGAGALICYYQQKNVSDSLIREIMALGLRKGEVIIGNRYVGKSLAMMLRFLGKPARCFLDDERQGYDFDNIPTFRADKLLPKWKDSVFVLAVRDNVERQIMAAIDKAYDGFLNVIHLSPFTFHELEMSPAMETWGLSAASFCGKSSEAIKNMLRKL